MYKAVEQSLNVPAVWLLNEIGLEKGFSSLERFGISLQKEEHYLAIALGGMRRGVSPMAMAEAYSVFVNEGKREDGHLITKIVGPTGNVIAEHKQNTVTVTSKRVAEDITSMLLGVVEEGTGKAAQIEGLPLAGKTGSTQLPYQDINGTKDQWFVGYTPNLVGAVWIGYDQTDREHYLSTSSSNTVVPLFRTIMEGVSLYVKHEDFSIESVQSKLKKEEEEKRRLLQDQTDQLKEKIKEQAPIWKEKLDKGMEELIEQGKRLKENMREWIGN